MVYTMEIYVDGACRGNGQPGAIGAAAAVFKPRWGRDTIYTEYMPDDYYHTTPTNQRAEITAIILALKNAWNRYQELDGDPYLEVTIHSDSRYAVGCMTEWIYKWRNNGWVNSAGCEVANRDLIERASDLHDRLCAEGSIKYVWIPRCDNHDADEACNDCMDENC